MLYVDPFGYFGLSVDVEFMRIGDIWYGAAQGKEPAHQARS